MSAVIPHTIVRYDREVHAPYVRESWAKAARLDRRELDWWLRRPETNAVVAHVPSAPHLLLGWSVAVPDEHFVVWTQVKKLWWGRGLGRVLTVAALGRYYDPEHVIRYAYRARLAEAISRGIDEALRFDPILARRVPRASDWISPGEVADAESVGSNTSGGLQRPDR
ncbi:MAG TPA: hypothetical protein VFP80_03265 [Thermoanaerobaculia bacterium]|nr:hypothetical protein [Thermoanaerobaculia bacterium]